MISGENLISFGYNGVKLQVIKEIQISRHMTRYGQTLGVFKRENNEFIRNGEEKYAPLLHVWEIKKLHFWFYADLSFLRCEYIHRFCV